MSIRHQIGNVVSVAYSAIRLSVMKLMGGGRIKSSLIERISPNVVIDIDNQSSLLLGKRVRLHSGTRITSAKGGIIEISDDAKLNNNCRIACRDHIVIGEGVEFGPGVLVYDHDHKFTAENGVAEKDYKTSPITIGKHSWVGANTIILRGTIIGENCVIGAGCVIRGTFEDGSLIYQERVIRTKRIE